jgi:hypothetical protein
MLHCFVLVVHVHPSFTIEINFVEVCERLSNFGVLSLVEVTSVISKFYVCQLVRFEMNFVNVACGH